MSKRAAIMTALKTRLGLILKTNGYKTDAGEQVVEWFAGPILTLEESCLLIADTRLTRPPNQIIGQRQNLLTIEVTGVLRGSASSLDEARNLEEDLISCIGGFETAGGLVDRLQVLSSTLSVEQQGQIAGGVMLTCEAEYYTADNIA